METLLDVLTQYVEENLVSRLLLQYTPQIRTARFRANQLSETLKSLHPEEENRIEALKMELDNVHFCREQAFLLAGISIGLELARI